MKSSPLIIALGGMIAMAAAIGIGRFVYTPILPYLADALALTKAEAGLIAAANFFGYLIGSLMGATGVMRGERRRWTLWALALSAATTAAMALTVSVPAFLLLRFVGGATSAFVIARGRIFMGITAVGMTTAREISLSGPWGGSGSDPRRMLGLIVAAFGAGQMAVPAFGGYIAGITGSFVVPSRVASGVLIVAACLVMTVRMPKA
jgi:MFS family permease